MLSEEGDILNFGIKKVLAHSAPIPVDIGKCESGFKFRLAVRMPRGAIFYVEQFYEDDIKVNGISKGIQFTEERMAIAKRIYPGLEFFSEKV